MALSLSSLLCWIWHDHVHYFCIYYVRKFNIITGNKLSEIQRTECHLATTCCHDFENALEEHKIQNTMHKHMCLCKLKKFIGNNYGIITSLFNECVWISAIKAHWLDMMVHVWCCSTGLRTKQNSLMLVFVKIHKPSKNTMHDFVFPLLVAQEWYLGFDVDWLPTYGIIKICTSRYLYARVFVYSFVNPHITCTNIIWYDLKICSENNTL